MKKSNSIKPRSPFDLKKDYLTPFDRQMHAYEPIEPNQLCDLSETLHKQGELRLLNGDASGLHYFDMALKLDPSNAKLYHSQGLALLEYGAEEGRAKELRLASKRFKIATRLNPKHFDAWHAWGNVLHLLGKSKNEKHFFNNSKNKYKKAIALISNQSPEVIAELYSDYGDIWMKLAEFSGEATDLHIALKAYETATTYLEDLSEEFWQNFGHVCLMLGKQTNDVRLFSKAINCYKNAISISISSSESWFFLAQSLKTIYSYTHDEDHFMQASECYETAANLKPSDTIIWLNWAMLLNDAGIANKDTKCLRSAIEKCRTANLCNTKDPLTITVWAEALAELGLITERLELIHEAEAKITEATELHEDLPEVWYSYGVTLTCLATYYNDLDTYYQAMEKFQEGLQLKKSCHKIWFALGKTSFIISQIENEPKSFERTCRFYKRAIGLHVSSSYHYNYAVALSSLGEHIHDENTIEHALKHFELAINLQKNAAYEHPEWLFQYGCTLDFYSEFSENEANYVKAIEILNHVLMVDPE
ncbi:MAG: hypothetical protein KAR79_00585, partial [Simkaniaceae bacterium]|nr:hypothetical protein [Simkaniaceae bacterium]